jgi:WS/DGAT/MGAT family acyltransferase
VKTETAASPIVPPAGKDAPACPLNRESTGRRTFARTSLAVADLKRVKDAAVVTLNDVALALVAGALRDYLSARGSRPERPLLAWVPVSLEGTDAPARTFGNRISALTTTLATDVADPWERLITIGAVTSRAKHLLSVGDPDLEGEWLDHLPPFVFDLALRRRRRASAGPDSNVVVSHVRGVRPGALQGAALESFYITGPPNNGGGVTVVLASYLDRIFVGILCVDAAVPAPGELADGLHRALAELLTIAAARAADGAQVKDLAGRT